MPNENDQIWLTKEAYDKLQNELDTLRGEGRATVIAKIAAARDEGDLSENGGYHAAREEQGQMEARIRQLEQLLREAQVGEADVNSDEIIPGSVVTVAFDGDEDDTETFLLGSRELLGTDDSVDISVSSPASPLGGAVLGHHAGDEVSYPTPSGKTMSVKILKVEPFSG